MTWTVQTTDLRRRVREVLERVRVRREPVIIRSYGLPQVKWSSFWSSIPAARRSVTSWRPCPQLTTEGVAEVLRYAARFLKNEVILTAEVAA